MKKLLLSILTLCCLNVFAQEETGLLTNRNNVLDREYMRPTISRIVIHDGSELAMRAADMFYKAHVAEKYNFNDIKISPLVQRNITKETDFKSFTESVIKDNRVGNRIMKNWFPNFTEGNGYDIDVILERGEYAATDNDILKQNASQRKTLLYELGEKLIDRSYCTVAFLSDSTYTKKKDNGDVVTHKRVYVRHCLYKLDFNSEVRTDFYTNHYMTAGGIDAMNFPMKFVKSDDFYTDIEIITEYTDDKGNRKKKTKLDDNSGGYYGVEADYGVTVADFQVKIPIVSVNPIAAKMGYKESLYFEKRCDVVEYVQKKDGTQSVKRVATVRCKKAVDNRTAATGHTDELSEFYYINGRAIKPGMTIMYNSDWGVYGTLKYGISGFDAQVGYRFSEFFSGGITGLFVYADFGMVNSEDGGLLKLTGFVRDKDKEGKELATGEWQDVNSFKVSIGFAKDFNFARNFVATPALEFGLWMPMHSGIILSEDGKTATPAPKDSQDATYGAGFYMAGIVQLGYMVTKFMEVYGETGFNVFTKNDTYKWMRDDYARQNNTDPADPQSMRLGMGVKVYF